MAAWIYTDCGRDPGYLIGGVPLDLDGSFERGSGDRFVIEGDEYNAAYFDREAKFHHYRAETLILTSAEFDHVDLYQTRESFLAAFRKLVGNLPPSGCLIACVDAPFVDEIAAEARCQVIRYGFPGGGVDKDVVARIEGCDDRATRFEIDDAEGGSVLIELPMWGEHNRAQCHRCLARRAP